MTKRHGSHSAVNGKRPRLEDEDLWEDDLDDDAIEKCFERASQVLYDHPSNDESILPSYDAFKKPAAIASSTQGHHRPGALSQLSVPELEAQIQELNVRNEEKEGEIAILKSKIKESSNQAQFEQHKTTSEWREKLQTTQKTLKSVSSELQFKNLEVANLKQQLNELKKVAAESSVYNNQSQYVPSKVNGQRKSDSKIPNISPKEIIAESVYPLRGLSPNIFLVQSKKNHRIRNRYNETTRNTIYLPSQLTCNEEIFHHKCPTLDNIPISLQHIYPDILTLINYSLEQINHKDSLETVQRILCVAFILLKDLNDYLEELGSHLKTEDIQQSDNRYLKSESQENHLKDSECAQLDSQVGNLLNVISKLILCNQYCINVICYNEAIVLPPALRAYAKLIPHRNGAVQSNYYFLYLVDCIIHQIGKYRLADEGNDILLSISNFLEHIAFKETNFFENPTTGSNYFLKIFREIIFTRPGHYVIEKLTYLLKVCSRYELFLQYLFKSSDTKELLEVGPKGILYFNEGVCSFCVLAILLEKYTSNVATISLEVCYNMLSFIYNSFKPSHWVHHESERNICGCLSQLYKLEISFVYKGFSTFLQSFNADSCHSDKWRQFLNHEIVQKVLNQMNFNNYELMEKNSLVFSKYKKIEKVLKRLATFNAPEMNITNDLSNITSKSFNDDF